jgi:nitric oxide reductase subunit B
MHFLGAGVWGFAHTLPQINKWTHGTQVTASHGHFAFFGAYVMINLTMIYFAVPRMTGARLKSHGRSLIALRLMVLSIFLMVLALGIAGVVQAYLQRVLGMDYLTVQDYMKLWYAVMWVSGWGVVTGVFVYIYDFFSLGRPLKIRT